MSIEELQAIVAKAELRQSQAAKPVPTLDGAVQHTPAASHDAAQPIDYMD
jgi:hypothetical protein